MTSRELRNQCLDEPAILSEAKTQEEAERKARKLAYRENRAAAASASKICGAGSFAGEPVARPALTPSERTGPTGPRSLEGKAISSGNSLKHGLASGRIIIPGEDLAAFEALLSDLTAEHAPANETESLLVQQMAQSWWLMQRAIRIQNEAFTETRVDTEKLALFLRYQTTYERAFYRALNSLMKLQKERRKSIPQFVSQNAVQPGSHPEFVSQNKPDSTAVVHSVGRVSTRDGLQPGKVTTA